MDFFDALKQLTDRFPKLPEDELRAALEDETKYEEERMKAQKIRRNRYAIAVESARDRMFDWLQHGTGARVDPLDLDSLCRAISGYRRGALWAIIRCKQMDAAVNGWPK